MENTASPIQVENWKIEKIGVIGPGIVGMPMAGMLAHAKLRFGTDTPAKVLVVQRDSVNSGWKVKAINQGKSVIGGIEPGLDDIVKEAVEEGLLSASHDISVLTDADVILVSVQTDKNGFAPDYGPLFGALEKLGEALQNKPADKIPLVIFESTLAPTTMDTLIRQHFKKYGLEEGKDILLGNSPNRVMPGRLIERIKASDKLAGGLHPVTPKLISKLYSEIVTEARVFETNSLTAEIVKTLENAYRDVRIAFSAEIVRFCDHINISFYQVREELNKRLVQEDNATKDPNAVPTGGILIPMLGVGGHCLPKDGILLWWRNIETGTDTSNSLILRSRIINEESPVITFKQAESFFGSLKKANIALLGVAYRFNSEDTRNSPTLNLANYLREEGIEYVMHDPYVKPDDQNLLKYDQERRFTNDLGEALRSSDFVFLCTPHKLYMDELDWICSNGNLTGMMDACNLYQREKVEKRGIRYSGIGRGKRNPSDEFIEFVLNSFQAMERGLAMELNSLIQFYNRNYAHDTYNKVKFNDVQKLARTCSTGCEIVSPDKVGQLADYKGFRSELAQIATHLSLENGR